MYTGKMETRKLISRLTIPKIKEIIIASNAQNMLDDMEYKDKYLSTKQDYIDLAENVLEKRFKKMTINEIKNWLAERQLNAMMNKKLSKREWIDLAKKYSLQPMLPMPTWI